MIMNPLHRTWANYVADWFLNAGNKIKNDWNDRETFVRFFDIGRKTKRWDSYVIQNEGVIIAWDNVPYGFSISFDGKVQRV